METSARAEAARAERRGMEGDAGTERDCGRGQIIGYNERGRRKRVERHVDVQSDRRSPVNSDVRMLAHRRQQRAL